MTVEYKLSHKLEQAGLGKPPYRCTGVTQETYQACHGAPIQPGSSCDYCGNAIIDTYWVVSSDGKRFKLGSDCIGKVSSKLNRRGDPLYQAVLKQKREKVHARNAIKIERARALLADPVIRAKLSTMPHLWQWQTDKGATLLDWAEWMMENAGDSGRMAVRRRLEDIAKQQETGGKRRHAQPRGSIGKLIRDVKGLLR